MDIRERLDEILKKKGWTRYRLSKVSDLSESTLTNIFHRGTVPTVATLETICQTLNISLAQFFANGEVIELTPELKELIEERECLTPEKRENILQTMKFMR